MCRKVIKTTLHSESSDAPDFPEERRQPNPDALMDHEEPKSHGDLNGPWNTRMT
jgi:hypothetical protein